MKILCETQVVNRQTHTTKIKRAAKATLGIGFRTIGSISSGKETKQMEIVHFTPQNRAGTRYKVYKNIDVMHTNFLKDGKITIGFREPPENLMVKCDPIQLKNFAQTVKLGMDGKDSCNLRLNIAAATAIPQKSQAKHKLIVLKRGDYPIKGFPKALQTLTVSGIQLVKVGYEVCSLQNLTSLDLSFNNISKMPPELGRLRLRNVHLNNNNLGNGNSWEWLQNQNIRKSLRELDLSANKLTYFVPYLIKLDQLITLKLNNNVIKRIPFGVRRMRNLRYLHISSNLLESLPSSFNYTRLEVLDVCGNNFQPQIEHMLSDNNDEILNVTSNATPLWLSAARSVSQYNLPYSSATLPWLLVDMLSELPQCSCGKLCYASAVLERAIYLTFQNVKDLILNRDRLIYADVVLCGPKCIGRKQLVK